MMTLTEYRAELKRGKKERIGKLLETLRSKQLWRDDPLITKERKVARPRLVAGRIIR